MKQTTINALAALAEATAEYESAWRASCELPVFLWEDGRNVPHPERREIDRAMRNAHVKQEQAIGQLDTNLGSALAAAIGGALIQASARTCGVRHHEHHVARAADFIQDCINGEAGV